MTKIVIIGGGSYAWGPLFIRDILVTPELASSTILLHDIDPEAMDLIFSLGQMIIRRGGFHVTLEKSGDLDEALEGADFVILTITTGRLEAMRHDLEIPARYGIKQSVGDTVGPGGLARSLRNIPIVLDIAQRMEKICPEAWLLNYTNPMTTLSRVVTRETSIKTIGLCHEYIGVRRKLAPALGVEATELQPIVAGINHLPWLLDLKIAGQDGMPRLHELAADILATRGNALGYKDEDNWSTIDRGMVKSRLLQIYGAMPVAGDRHLAEFFPFFLVEATDYGRKYGIEMTSIEERYQWRARDNVRIHAILSDEIALRPFLENASHEAANKIIRAIVTNGSYTGIMNLPNQGQIANLPSGVVVETFGVVDATGAHGISAGPLPPGIHTVVDRHVTNQEMTVDAALAGDRSLVLQVMLNEPMMQIDPESASQMLEEMLLANKQYLPRFFT